VLDRGAVPRLCPVSLVTVDRSRVSENNNHGTLVIGVGGAIDVTITGSVVTQNGGTALFATGNATIRLAGTTVAQNAVGISALNPVESQGNNFIFGNATEGDVPNVVGSK